MDFSSYLFSCLIKIMLYLFGGHPGDAYYFCNIQFFNATQCKHQLLFRRQISCETENQILQFLIDQIERRRALASGEAKPEDFADEDPCHQTMIRPFLLARQSTVAKTTHQQSAEAALNLGTYL